MTTLCSYLMVNTLRNGVKSFIMRVDTLNMYKVEQVLIHGLTGYRELEQHIDIGG